MENGVLSVAWSSVLSQVISVQYLLNSGVMLYWYCRKDTWMKQPQVS